VGEAALAESTLALEAGARRLAALDTRLRATFHAADAAVAAVGGPFAGQMAALQSPEAWLPSALAGMSLPRSMDSPATGAAAGSSGSDSDEAPAAVDPGDVTELSSALALTQQVRQDVHMLASHLFWSLLT
jgi:hypothetical protein